MRSKEENRWADDVLAKASGNIVGAKEVPALVAEYESRFKKKIKGTSLKCWLWRRERISKKNSQTTRRGLPRAKKIVRHNDAENTWAKGALSRMKNEMRKIGHSSIVAMNLQEEFQKQFGRPLSVGAIYTWLRSLGGSTPRKGKKKDLGSLLMDEITKYLLVVNGIPMTFDSEESLKSAIENPEVGQVMRDIKLFTATPINIKREVTVSIGK